MGKVKNRGITLIALVITIIILLILAGISISALTGSGLLEKAKLAKEKSENAQDIENNILLNYESKINDVINEKNSSYDDDINISGRYILFEVYDHISGEGASISEIKIYDKNGNLVPYTVMTDKAFDSANNGLPYYWNEGRFWNYTNLYDGNINYSSNSEGGQNCTAFLYESNANSNNYARFLVDLGEILDIEDIKICIGGVDATTPKSVSAYMINNYTSDTYANNVAQRNNEGLTLIKTIEFSSVILEPTWYSFVKEFESKRILFEVYDHIDGSVASIAEIKIYDKNGNLVPYTVMADKAFDSANNGLPFYWNEGRFWNYTNLYDGNINYSSNSEGGQNCTAFLYESNANTNNYARFIVDLGEISDIEDVKICIGGVDATTPKSVSAYMINNYTSDTYANNVAQRNNEGLTLIKTIEFSSVISEPIWYSFVK